MIRGVDVSRWNWPIDWPALRALGIEFAGIRCTMGASGVDPLYAAHLAGALAADVWPISYHLLSPHLDPILQAGHFLRHAKTEAFAVDVEPSNGVAPASFQRWADVSYGIGCEISARVASPPLTYGSPAFLRQFPWPPDSWGMPLWIADWRGNEEPEVPPPWRRATVWQRGTMRPHPGAAPLDFDTYEGTLDELRRELVFTP